MGPKMFGRSCVAGINPEKLFLDGNTAYRATIGGLTGTFSPTLVNYLCLTCILVKFKDFGANLRTNSTAYALVTIDFHDHGDLPPPPKWRF